LRVQSPHNHEALIKLHFVLNVSDDTRDDEATVEAGTGGIPSTYCLASIGESTMEIKFTVGESPLGSLLVAATDKGVCAVSLRESDAGAEDSLRARFPKAEIKRDDAALKRAIDTVRERIAGRKLDASLPLDLQGTEFQCAVWNQLLAIPAGKTRTYLDVAQAISRPKATRAVAQACGANPVAVVVPCHRVVMSDGSIGGYSGLPGVKKALLTAEGVTEFARSSS
jgi:AraC family transcriptional regulator, regulatory protein of adaptative response / methylated-DNA-[protein]-cysteine methyltransferase